MSIALKDTSPDALEHLLPMIGTIFFAFAQFESVMTAHLKALLIRSFGENRARERNFALSHAIIGSNRYAASRDLFNRILRAFNGDDEIKKYYASIFAQVGEIAKFRDRLAHQYTFQATDNYEGLWINSNYISIKEAGTEEPWLFPAIAIMAASSDLTGLRDCFDGYLEHRVIGPNRLIPYSFELPAWRYKPVMIVRGNQNVLRTLRGSVPQPQSWIELAEWWRVQTPAPPQSGT